MRWWPRRQLPVYSPLPLRAVLAGFRALLAPGDARARVEARIRDRFGARRLLLVDSGTSALALAMKVASRGRPVALPAWGCYDLATAADAAEVPVLLYDLDPRTLGPDPASFDAMLKDGPGAVVLVHYFGLPVDVPRFAERCRTAGALVIEDAAQGAGGKLRGVPLGGFGPLSVLSFGRGKGMTGGGGGALFSTTPEADTLVDEAAAHAGPAGRGVMRMVALAAQWVFGRPWLYWIPASIPWLHLGETIYRPPHPAAAIPVACCAVLDRTWEPALGAVAGRAKMTERWRPELPGGLLPPVVCEGAEPGWLRLPVTKARTRENDRESQWGIAVGYPCGLSELDGFAERIVNPGRARDGAMVLAATLITLPVHAAVRASDITQAGLSLADRPAQARSTSS
jgi:perosamine synthetase